MGRNGERLTLRIRLRELTQRLLYGKARRGEFVKLFDDTLCELKVRIENVYTISQRSCTVSPRAILASVPTYLLDYRAIKQVAGTIRYKKAGSNNRG